MRRPNFLYAWWWSRWRWRLEWYGECEACHGDGRERINYGHNDVRDILCTMCGGSRCKVEYDRTLAEIRKQTLRDHYLTCKCYECAPHARFDQAA
jgi:hypothetical protein